MHPTCPSACNVEGTIWTCSCGVVRFIDKRAISVFQLHRTHPPSFVSLSIPAHLCSLSSESHMHYGEGTFLRVELCQRSSFSLRLGICIAFFKCPIMFYIIDTGYRRANMLVSGHHKHHTVAVMVVLMWANFLRHVGEVAASDVEQVFSTHKRGLPPILQ